MVAVYRMTYGFANRRYKVASLNLPVCHKKVTARQGVFKVLSALFQDVYIRRYHFFPKITRTSPTIRKTNVPPERKIEEKIKDPIKLNIVKL